MSCKQSLSDVACTFEFLNLADDCDEDYYLLKRNTPLEGLLSQFVAVSYEGRRLEYKGIFIHRDPPTKDEYILLKAGQKVSATVHINDAFALIHDGGYTIEYIRPLVVLDEMQMPIEVNAKTATYIHLENARYLSHPFQRKKVKSEGSVTIESCTTATFVGGTSSQREDVLNAHRKLCTGFADAKNNVSNSDLYTTWFGTYTEDRGAKVKGVLDDCVEGLTNDTVTYTFNGPKCQSTWNAYTYKGGTDVYLCPRYNLYEVYCKSSGSPTKESILAHEWSHALAYTEDYVYGATANKALAKSDPDKAVNNADTYEYWYCLTQF